MADASKEVEAVKELEEEEEYEELEEEEELEELDEESYESDEELVDYDFPEYHHVDLTKCMLSIC